MRPDLRSRGRRSLDLDQRASQTSHICSRKNAGIRKCVGFNPGMASTASAAWFGIATQRAVQLNPNFAMGYNALGNDYYSLDQVGGPATISPRPSSCASMPASGVGEVAKCRYGQFLENGPTTPRAIFPAVTPRRCAVASGPRTSANRLLIAGKFTRGKSSAN